jgi:DNA-binding transcriptional ArsR family regulator
MASDSTATDSDPPTDVFALLSDETRVGIVRELAAADRPVRFGRLRERLDCRDSGRFNYHLRRLRGALVEKRDDGYVLTDRGRQVAAATGVIAATAN